MTDVPHHPQLVQPATTSCTSRPSPSSTNRARWSATPAWCRTSPTAACAEDKIRHLANFDALTNLPNRRQLMWRAERRAGDGAPPGPPVRAAADRPGPLQDHQRHAGPPVGRRPADGGGAPAARLRAPLRPGAGRRVYEGRRHGRALAPLAGGRGPPGRRRVRGPAARGGRRTRRRARGPAHAGGDARAHRRGGQECFVTASVGVAMYPRDGTTVADLLRNSDVAMYSVKATGRNASALVRPAAGRPRAREARARDRAAQGHRAQRAGAALPAQDRRAQRAHGRRRGADALAAWRHAGAAGRLHPAGRGDRAHRAAVGMGHGRGRAPGQAPGSRASASPSRSPSTCPAGCSSAATSSTTSTRSSPRRACRTA
jgi:GGDEF domain-containing protein